MQALGSFTLPRQLLDKFDKLDDGLSKSIGVKKASAKDN